MEVQTIALILIFVGLTGILAMTWLFPFVGTIFKFLIGKDLKSFSIPNEVSSPKKILIVIPVHNEEKVLENTLRSLIRSKEAFIAKFPQIEVTILTALDGCSDNSLNIASRLSDTLQINENSIGKWSTIRSIVVSSTSFDWIILADAGVIWDEDLITNLFPYMSDGRYLSVAPTYRNPKAGYLEDISWRLESHLKGLENKLMGPISIHGATVCYESTSLRKAFDELADRNWLNDDIVIPLKLRELFPDKSVVYLPTISIHDQAQSGVQGSQYKRRIRMVLGNIEWIKSIWPSLINKSHMTAIIACRRIFRIFWAYWLTALLLGISTFIVSAINSKQRLAIVLLFIIFFFYAQNKNSLKRLKDAATASFKAPSMLFGRLAKGGGSWR